MLSLCELRRAAPILDRHLAGTRVQRFVQPDDFRLIVIFYGSPGTVNLLLSCRPDFARICTVERVPEAPPNPPSLLQFLRAHLARARFDGIEMSTHDRQLAVRLSMPDGAFRLIFSIAGARSNIYVADTSARLVHAMRPVEATRGDLRIGEAWVDVVGSPPSEGIDRWREISDENYLRAIGEHYERLERSRAAAILARRVETVLGKEEKFFARKGANLLEDLAQARQAAEYRRKGELLKTVLHTIRCGDESVTVTDYETGEGVLIAIDPKLSPSENLESYFTRYQKESRGITQIQQQIEELQTAQRELESLGEKLQAIVRTQEPDLDALKELASNARVRRLLGRYYPSQKRPAPAITVQGKKEVPGKLQPKRYRSEGGLEIWVGKSDEGNDYLTTRLARGNDLFFHLEGYPGSHVVLRTEGSENPPQNALLDACELAVHFSRMKEASRADVHVTAVKNVRKPKGAKPGLVYVLKGKTIHLRRDPKRLRNLLANRLDD